MEALTDILRGLRTSGSVYFCDYLHPPWRLEYADEPRAMFHLVRRGRCRVTADGESWVLESGDFVFLAPGVDHAVVSCSDDDPEALLLCGYCRFELDAGDVLIRALPVCVVLRREQLEAWPWLWRTLEHLSAEYLSEAPGSELTVNKLTEVLLVQLLRIDFGRPDKAGLAAALGDRRLLRVLNAIHGDPGGDWTLERAAATAAMSRSGFARRFKETLATGFFDYLTRLRMRNARNLLAATRLPVADIAERVGYRSEVAFVKAFRKRQGATPRAYRQSGGREPGS